MDKFLMIALAQTLFPFVISPGASFVLTLSASTASGLFMIWLGGKSLLPAW